MQIKIQNQEELNKENTQLPKWVIILMKAYEEYIGSLGGKDAD